MGTGKHELINAMKKRKWSFLGHSKRHQSWERLIMEGRIPNGRGRGRPRRWWIQDIKVNMNMDLATARVCTGKRCFWKGCHEGYLPEGRCPIMMITQIKHLHQSHILSGFFLYVSWKIHKNSVGQIGICNDNTHCPCTRWWFIF